jgi:hypothetical protein
LESFLTPSENEQKVRVYHCTSFSSKLLGLKAEGYLTITNMRVVFYAYGSSYGGSSVIHSEVPIADVSCIASYVGTYFSITHFLTALTASFVVSTIINVFLNMIFVYILYNSGFLKEIFSFGPPSEIHNSISTALLGGFIVIGLSAALLSLIFKSNQIWKPILTTVGTLLLAVTGGLKMIYDFMTSLSRSPVGLGAIVIFGAIILGIYTIVTYFLYSRRETMSLVIGSKGGSYAPIAIMGATSLGTINVAALKTLTAEPADDVDVMIKELGAVITDIQTLGDVGVEKWKNA